MAMAILLVALGFYLHGSLANRLDETIEGGLSARADELTSRIAASGAPTNLGDTSGGVIEDDESFTQVLTPAGELVASTPQLDGTIGVPEETVAAAAGGATFADVPQLPGLEGPSRVLVTPVTTDDGRELLAVVGVTLDDRDEALGELRDVLLVGGSIALLLASLAGYAAIGAALRPVEAMRERAAAITAGGEDERLPAGAADDELARLAATLNEMLARLHAGLERERRFVDDASHELRTPLALHRTALELALRYEADDPGLRAAVASSIEEVDRLIQLAEDLLVVARDGEGGLELNRQRLRVADLLDGVATRFRQRAGEEGRMISADAPADLEIDADRIRLEQALTNMTDNALRHGAGAVRLSAVPAGESVRLHVADEGPGFPEGFAEHAFERFTRADAARPRGGVGLGLAIVATIAAAHGGSAGAANDPEGGADVWIELSAASGTP